MFLQVYLVFLLVVKCYSYQSCCVEYNRHKIPQDVMVGVVNNLALKLLAIHNENNDNNIAISPYGALSVLVALTEAVQGNAASEIQRAAGIPSDLSVVRIGLRDIHRHLKSYFIPEEGFLSGMTLSHDNVTLNPEFEETLKFYGFDINSFNNALYPDFTTTESMSTETATSTITPNYVTTTTASSTSEQTESVASTTETVQSSEISTSTVTEETTESVTSTEAVKTTRSEISTTMLTEATTLPTTTESASSTEAVRTTRSEITTTAVTETTTLPTTTEAVRTRSTPVAEEMTTQPIVMTTDEAKSTTTAEIVTELPMTSTESESVKSPETTTTELSDINATTSDEMMSTTNMVELKDEIENFDKTKTKRATRSVVDYIIARYYDERVVTQRPPPYNTENNLSFLINGKYKENNINYMTYDAVLPFHYLPHLDALALRFPLDSSRYYLLLVLPQNPQMIDRLVCDLRLNSSLKYIIDNLRYTHVRAIIPSFMLKGYVILTPTLQKMGISRVFEPRQADFSPMTEDRNIYVTNIEQAITVNIRNYVDPATTNNNRYLTRNEPVLFKADHPFLYFVIDSEIDVTLMAGKIVNPLNSRIR